MLNLRIEICHFFIITLIFCSAQESIESIPSSSKPNVLFILADDLGWNDLGCYGSGYFKTPSLDALAKSGTRFTRAYSASPVCSPTRASIITGLYPGRIGITEPWGHLPNERFEVTLPLNGPKFRPVIEPQGLTRLKTTYPNSIQTFKQEGYLTGFFGKWHLGHAPHLPTNFGADMELPGGSYPGPPSFLSPYKIPNFKDGPPGEHIDERLVQEIITFIKANPGKPFYINFWMFSVHSPFQANPLLIEKYRTTPSKTDQKSPTMAAMIEHMDRSVGTLIQALKDLHVLENTLIVFTSDNGGNMYDEIDGTTPTNNSPLKGGKGMIEEGGSRVPLIVSWKNKVAEGKTSDQLISSVDYFPTFLELLGKNPNEINPISTLFMISPRILAKPTTFQKRILKR